MKDPLTAGDIRTRIVTILYPGMAVGEALLSAVAGAAGASQKHERAALP